MSKVLLAKTLSSTSHIGQRYGTENYFDYHICGVVESLKIHDLSEEFIIVEIYILLIESVVSGLI